MICHRSVKRAMVFLIYNYKAGAKWRTCPSPLPLCKRKEQMQLQLVKHVDNHPGCGMWRLSQLNKEVGFVVWISEMVDHLNLLDLVFIWQVAFHLFWDASQQEMTRSMPNYLFQKGVQNIHATKGELFFRFKHQKKPFNPQNDRKQIECAYIFTSISINRRSLQNFYTFTGQVTVTLCGE